MHVPQAGDEVAACCVDHVRIVGYPDLVGRADGHDAVARDKNSLFGTERPIRYIDDRNILDGHDRADVCVQAASTGKDTARSS